jgi:2,3-bisphosphoglycerate-independent phosphoglycerate mutase
VRNHSGDPVPLTIYCPGSRKDDVDKFDEISCANGALGRIRGKDLLPIMMDLVNRSEMYGA